MKKTRLLALALLLLTLAACSQSLPPAEPTQPTEPAATQPATTQPAAPVTAAATTQPTTAAATTLPPLPPSTGTIYLYGEAHGVERIMDKEREIWYEYYHNDGLRHLFIEQPYYTAEFLNIWMHLDSDDILEEMLADWAGTAMNNPHTIPYYKGIKEQCPETVFHGTDVGHQYGTIGARYLEYLEANGMKGSENYLLAKETIEQGETFYKDRDFAYREVMMAENFIREFDALAGESIMGIYGAAHTYFDADEYMTGTVPCMAKVLKARYGEAVFSEDMAWIAKYIEPIRTETLTVAGKEYTASYFGGDDMQGHSIYTHREFWRLEDAYDDFKNRTKTGIWIPCSNYPMMVEDGQVFYIDFTKIDGTVIRSFYRSDGSTQSGEKVTNAFIPN